MNFTIKNCSHQLLVITLNSGETIHLAPQEISKFMDEVEIKGNSQLEKMKKYSLIAIAEERESSPQEATERQKQGDPELSGVGEQGSGNHTLRD